MSDRESALLKAIAGDLGVDRTEVDVDPINATKEIRAAIAALTRANQLLRDALVKARARLVACHGAEHSTTCMEANMGMLEIDAALKEDRDDAD